VASARSVRSVAASDRPASENAVYLRRAEKQLEATLHRLLDEQSDALLADADAARPQERQQRHSQRGGQKRAAQNKQHDLPATRRAIHRAVRELAAVKAAQEADAQRAHRETQRTVARLDTWAAKRAALRREVARLSRGVAAAAGNNAPPPSTSGGRGAAWSTVLGLSTVREDEPPLTEVEEAEEPAADEEHDPDVAAALALRAQADALQDAVVAAEQRLGRLRQRHARLLDKLALAENGVQSRLAKYTASLRALDDEIAGFLAREDGERDAAAVAGGQRSGRRIGARGRARTLELAREEWATRQAGIERGLDGARREREALEEGAAVWTESVAAIDGFERKLQAEMARLAGASRTASSAGSPRRNASSSADAGDAAGEQAAESMARLVADMSSTMAFVSSRLRLARSRDWRLLQACIGAELEAFRQGRAALERAAGLQHTPPADEYEDELSREHEPAGRGYDGGEEAEDSVGSYKDDTVYEDARGGEEDEVARDLLGAMAADAAVERGGIELDRRKAVPLVYDSDDGPGPELLVAKPRSDSE
jgi:hypothetical protein